MEASVLTWSSAQVKAEEHREKMGLSKQELCTHGNLWEAL